MRFVITGEWDKNRLLKLILAMYLGYVVLFWLSAGLLYFAKMDLTAASVQAYFLGDIGEEFGRPPRAYASMLETSHMHLFAMGMLVMVLTHLLLFAPIRPATKGRLVVAAFVTTLADELANWLVRFVDPAFAYFKVASLLAMEASLLALIIAIGLHLRSPTRNAYKDTATAQGGR